MEECRKALVNAMKHGNALVLECGSLMMDFVNDWTAADDVFNPNIVFNFEEIRKKEVYMNMVREEENVDIFGDKGNFVCKPAFNVIILAKYRDEACCQELMDKVPHSADFAKYSFE